jgi:hypothetical protein
VKAGVQIKVTYILRDQNLQLNNFKMITAQIRHSASI